MRFDTLVMFQLDIKMYKRRNRLVREQAAGSFNIVLAIYYTELKITFNVANEHDQNSLMFGNNVLKHFDLIVTTENAEFRRNDLKLRQLKEINQVTAIGLQKLGKSPLR